MKKIISICVTLFLCGIIYCEDNFITIDNTKHKYEDNFFVTNQTSEIISLDIFVKRKENTAENKVGTGLIPPKKSRVQINTTVDGEFDNYDYILIQPSGNLKDYKVECKNDDLILTINSYEGLENTVVNLFGTQYNNELIFENTNSAYRDYIKVKNKTSSYVNCSIYGIPKDSEKEVFIGQGVIDPNTETEIKTYYDGRLKELGSIRFTSDAEIKDYEISSSSHDMNLIIYACKGGKDPVNMESENDYEKADVLVDFQGKYKRENSGLYIYSFSVSVSNNTGKIIKVKFDESSISYNRKTSLPFIDGQKYVDAGNPPPNKIVPNGTKSDFSLYAANQISWGNGNWHISSMGNDVTVVLAIEINSKTYYWVSYAKINN